MLNSCEMMSRLVANKRGSLRGLPTGRNQIGSHEQEPTPARL
jgi:hypothetical protein